MSVTDYIWYEKYRPKQLKNMVLSPAYRKRFSDYISSGDIPHLLFYGPAGSGKTTLAFILMDAIPCSRLILNASSEDRGIATIKGKVKQFAASQALDKKLKIVFLDEADKLTGDAMDALRNTIETYSKTCRFILTGNYVDKFTDALMSRCTRYEFKSYSINQLTTHVEGVLQAEKTEYVKEDLDKLIELFYPDIRTIMNSIQAGSIGGKFDPKLVTGANLDVQLLLDYLYAGEVGKLRVAVTGASDFVWAYRLLFDELLADSGFTDEIKSDIVGTLAEYMFRDAMVVSREINFIACCVALMGVIQCKKISFNF